MTKPSFVKDGDLLENAKPQTLEQATSTALAVREVEVAPESEVTVSFGHFTSTPDLKPEDVIMPQLRLAQGLTTEVMEGNARPGQWLLSGEEPSPKYTFIPLAIQAGRELRDAAQEGKVVCRSDDRVQGRGVPGGWCEDCPFSKWQEATTDHKAVPPPCNPTYRYVGYVVEADTLAILTFRKTAYNVGKQLNSYIQAKRLGHFAVSLSSTTEKSPKGTFAKPVVALAKVEPEIIEYAQSLGQ